MFSRVWVVCPGHPKSHVGATPSLLIIPSVLFSFSTHSPTHRGVFLFGFLFLRPPLDCTPSFRLCSALADRFEFANCHTHSLRCISCSTLPLTYAFLYLACLPQRFELFANYSSVNPTPSAPVPPLAPSDPSHSPPSPFHLLLDCISMLGLTVQFELFANYHTPSLRCV